MVVLYASLNVLNLIRAATGSQSMEIKRHFFSLQALLLTMFLFQKWLGSPFPEDV